MRRAISKYAEVSVGVFLVLSVMLILGGCAKNELPIARIASPQDGARLPERRVTFRGEGRDPDGQVVSYLWDFGDGTTSNQQNPVHIFERGGTYVVTLRVVDNRGAIAVAFVRIHVNKDPEPQLTVKAAAYPASPTELFGIAPFTVYLSAEGSFDPDGFVTSYNWFFGDQARGQGINVSHTYEKTGKYVLTLVVWDNEEGRTRKEITVIVKEPLSITGDFLEQLRAVPYYEVDSFREEAAQILGRVRMQIFTILEEASIKALEELHGELLKRNFLETWTQDLYELVRKVGIEVYVKELMKRGYSKWIARELAEHTFEADEVKEIVHNFASQLTWDWCVVFFRGYKSPDSCIQREIMEYLERQFEVR